jgi:hypothetical protein
MKINPDAGLIRYTALRDAGEHAEAMAYADGLAEAYAAAADTWLNRAGEAHLGQIQAGKTEGVT